jgi:ActR/RegA family two-component response regulator
MAATVKILFVDDEPAIRTSLPAILRLHGFEVTAAGSVSQALQAIGTQSFDVLISDLNIGSPGDGFTVVSAMRRTQPDCVNIILTGYPAFESALEAIRSQVDDYLIKPCDAHTLVTAIEQRMNDPRPQHRIPAKRLATFLRDKLDIIVARALQVMKAHRQLGALPLSDTQRIDNLPDLLLAVARSLERENPVDLTDAARAFATEHGHTRRAQEYTLPMIVDDTRLVEQAIYDLVQQSLLELDLSYLILDLRRVNDTLEHMLQESLNAYLEYKAA